jgi:hypothetical protein
MNSGISESLAYSAANTLRPGSKRISPQQARSDSGVRARTSSAEPEFGAQKISLHIQMP